MVFHVRCRTVERMIGCGGVDSESPLNFHVFIILFLWDTPLYCRFLVSAEIITIDNFTVVFRSGTDAHFYVVGDAKEVGREGGTLEKEGKQGGAVRVKSKWTVFTHVGPTHNMFMGYPGFCHRTSSSWPLCWTRFATPSPCSCGTSLPPSPSSSCSCVLHSNGKVLNLSL